MFSNEILRLGALAIREDGTYTPFSGDAWLYALEMTLLGMGMIFSVLIVLWMVLAVFKLVFAREPKKEKKTNATPVADPAPVAEPAPTVAVAQSADDAELVAILTAAIYAYEAENNPDAPIGSFRVVSYRRTNGGRSWNAK